MEWNGVLPTHDTVIENRLSWIERQLIIRTDGESVVLVSIDEDGLYGFPGGIQPGTPAGFAQTAVVLYAGDGVPNNSLGEDGSWYFRGDSTTPNERLWHKESGTWEGVA